MTTGPPPHGGAVALCSLSRQEQREQCRRSEDSVRAHSLTGIIVKLNLEPVANLMVRANDTFAAFEGMLIAEIAAGNANTGTPMAACGRVAFGIAWSAMRTHILPKLSEALAAARTRRSCSRCREPQTAAARLGAATSCSRCPRRAFHTERSHRGPAASPTLSAGLPCYPYCPRNLHPAVSPPLGFLRSHGHRTDTRGRRLTFDV
jgi:hypothetical protein